LLKFENVTKVVIPAKKKAIPPKKLKKNKKKSIPPKKNKQKKTTKKKKKNKKKSIPPKKYRQKNTAKKQKTTAPKMAPHSTQLPPVVVDEYVPAEHTTQPSRSDRSAVLKVAVETTIECIDPATPRVPKVPIVPDPGNKFNTRLPRESAFLKTLLT